MNLNVVMISGDGIKPISSRPYCQPEGVTLNQMARIVVKYLEDNPALLHHPRGPLVLTALSEAFPVRFDNSREVGDEIARL